MPYRASSWLAFLVLVAGLGLCAPAAAQGGMGGGGGPGIDPGAGGGTTPPPEPPGELGPPPSAPTLPGGSGGRGSGRGTGAGVPGGGGAGPSSPGGGGVPGGGPSTPGSDFGNASGGGDPTRWSLWWRYNAAEYLDVRGLLEGVGRPRASVTGGDTIAPADPLRAPALRVLIDERLRPALLELLASAENPEVLVRASLALGSIGDPQRSGSVQRLSALVGHANQSVSEAAVLALGVLGRDDTAPLLAALLAGGERARTLRGSAPSERLQAFAAYGLGQVARQSSRLEVKRFAALELARACERAGGVEVPSACVLSFGLIELPWAEQVGERDSPSSSRQAQIAWLLERLEDGSASRFLRAHVPISLARVLAPHSLPPERRAELEAVVARLSALLEARARTPNEVTQGCAQALGFLADADGQGVDREVRRRLADHKALRDQQTRAFALVALARIGARPGQGDEPTAGTREVAELLARELSGGRGSLRPWAALAAGILARPGSVEPQPQLVAALRALAAEERSPELLGAVCIGLGIAGDEAAGDVLASALVRSADPSVQAYALLGLGMVGARAHQGQIEAALDKGQHEVGVLRGAAVALALMRSPGLIDQLLELLGSGSSLSRQAAVCAALGLIGESRSGEVLLVRARDEQVATLARAMALAALGRLAEKERKPWNTSLSIGANYRANAASLTAGDLRGVLDL